MKRTALFSLTFLLLLAFTACENPYVSTGEEPEAPKSSDKLVITVPEQADFSYTHLCFAIYDMAGKRLRQTNQTSDDAKLGSCTYRLEDGEYQLVVLAHSCAKNPAMTNPEKIQFNNSQGYTETFLYYDILDAGATDTVCATLQRVVSMGRFVIADSIPDGITDIRCEYTGGSGYLSAVTGRGVTGKAQTATFSVQPGQPRAQLDFYTFLPDEADSVTLTVTAINSAGKKQLSRTFTLPMRQNQITWLTGRFFNETTQPSDWTIIPNISIDPQWSGETYLTY